MYFINWNAETIENKFYTVYFFFRINFYRIKANGDNSSKEEKVIK